MSAQKERKFRSGPAYNAPEQSAAPSVRTGAYQPTAANVQPSGRSLADLGNALSGFFGGAADAANKIEQIDHQQTMVQIGRENQPLEWEATADKAAGRVNPAHMDRLAYAGTYTTALADDHADKLTAGLKDRLAKMKLDGSEDPYKIAEDYYKSEVGNGTGDSMFDSRAFYQFKKSADQLVVHQNEVIRQTVESNAWNTVRTDVARQMTSGNGVTVGQVADLYERVRTMARGNEVVADKQIESILGEAINNDVQARSALNGLEELGYAKRNPDSYLRLSQKAFERTNAIKTWQAGEDVQKWHQEFMEAQVSARGVMAPDTILGFASRATQIDSKHGVGMDRFMGNLSQAWNKALHAKASVNLVKAAYFGEVNGMRDGTMVAAMLGEPMGSILTKHFDQGVAAIAGQLNQASGGAHYGELMRTAKGGMLDPLATPKAAQEFAMLTGSDAMRRASPEGLSKTYKVQIGNALIGPDPQAAQNAFEFLKTYETVSGSPEFVRQALGGDAEFMAYQAARQFALTGRNVADHFARRQSVPEDVTALSKEARGNFDWPTLTGNPSAKAHEVEADVRKRIATNLREAVGRDAWFSKPGMVFESSKAEGEAFSAVAQFLREQGRSGGSLNVADAVEAALPLIRSQFVTLPGQGASMVLMRDPYAGKGRNVDHPIAVHEGRPVYAGFPIKNKLGEIEDPVKTFREDLEGMRKTLPGLLAAHGQEVAADSMFLMRPDTVTGLHPIARPTGEQVTLYPGMTLTLPGKRRYKAAETAYKSWADMDFEVRPDVPGTDWQGAGKVMGGNPLGIMGANLKAQRDGKMPDLSTVLATLGVPGAKANVLRSEPSEAWDDQVAFKTPSDPAAFQKLVRDRLPPGVFLVPGPYTGPRGEQSFSLAYGFRVKGDRTALDKRISDREQRVSEQPAERAEHEAWMRQRQQDLNPRREAPPRPTP